MLASNPALCTQLADLKCQAELDCCSAPSRSLEECRRALQVDCAETLYLDRLVNDASVGFDPQGAERFFAELAQKLSACDREIAGWTAGPDGLRQIFQGTVDSGESCKPADLLNADQPAQAAALLSCRGPAENACLPASLLGEWTCQAKSAVASECLTDDNCQADAYCDLPEQSVIGTCQARQATGAECTGASQCRSVQCVDGVCVEPTVDLAYCPVEG